MQAKWAWGLIWSMVVLGCSSEAAKNPPPSAAPAAPATMSFTPLSPDVRDLAQPQPQPTLPSQPAPAPATQPAVPGTPGAAPVAVTPQPAMPETEQVKAQKGVGMAGRSLDPYEGAVVTPAKTLFTVRERVVFEAQIPEALKLFKAMDANGRGPKSHDEFMTQIIQANQIPLPQLNPGQRYVYNPQTEELMVERPRQ